MAKYVVMGIGVFFILFGGADYWYGAPMPHDRFLLWLGGSLVATSIVALVVAGIRYLRKRSRQNYLYLSLAIAIFGAVDACAETIHAGVLTPPTHTPMIQRSIVTGAEAWLYVLLAVVVWVAFCYGLAAFFRGCSWRNRPRCNYPQGQ